MYRHVTISARGGTEIRVEAVAAIADLPAEDVTGDGYPDLALETRQGGSRCCSGTILYSLGPEPVVEPDIAQTPDYYGTGSGAWDDLDGDGTYEFVTRDPIAAFPCTAPTAPVVLRHVPGQGYVGAGPRYVGAFAAEIAALVERAERERESSRDGYRCGVLGLMLAYLYSGQEGVARQELDRLYLGSDRDAFWDDLVTAVRAGRFYVGP